MKLRKLIGMLIITSILALTIIGLVTTYSYAANSTYNLEIADRKRRL